MQRWQTFLNSLATIGGNLLLLALFCGVFLAIMLHQLHHGDTNQTASTIATIGSGFFGALLAALRGRTSDTPPAGTTVTTTASVATTSEPNTPPPGS